MAGIDADTGTAARRSTGVALNLTPMIDILVALTAFLLITAVWTQIGALQAHHRPAADEGGEVRPEGDDLTVVVQREGFRLGYTAADTVALPGRAFTGLRGALQERHRANPSRRDVWISPDSDVPFDRVAHAMDVVQDVWRENGGDPALVRLR